MLVIASTGRCGTQAIATGLTRFSDRTVEHEPRPRLLREAFLKHIGSEHRTSLLESRLEWFRGRQERGYGETFRAAPLLDDLADALAAARFLLLVREPYSYVRSAMTRRVLLRGDEWDLYRLLPLDVDLTGLSRADVIALHWREVNRYLLGFQARQPGRARIMVLRDLRAQISEIGEFAAARVGDKEGLAELVGGRPNRAPLRDAVRDLRNGEPSSLAALIAARARIGGGAVHPESIREPAVRRAVERTWKMVLSAEP